MTNTDHDLLSHSHRAKASVSRWLIAAAFGTILVIVGGGTWFYQSMQQTTRERVADELAAIAQLKAAQIADWRTNQLAESQELTASPFFSDEVAHWLASPAASGSEEILTRLQSLQEHYRYHEILLTDTNGQIHLSINGRLGSLCPEMTEAISAAFRLARPRLTDLHTDVSRPFPHLSAVAPLLPDRRESRTPVAAVVLVSDARQFLYPLIESWPTSSRTAETLLIRRDGDHALFLNELRHQTNTALRLRIALTQTNIPEVRAALGQEGMAEGTDYRGVEVLATVKAIPDTSWFIVAKMDAAEAFAVTRLQLRLALAAGFSFLALTGAAVAVAWQRKAKTHYRNLFQAEAARRASVERHSVTLRSIGDAVIATDAEGRVEVLNPAAEKLTGWSEAEARGRPLKEVFRIICERSRLPSEDPVAHVLREGKVVGLASHTLLLARDGTERPIAHSAAPIFDEPTDQPGGLRSISGVVLVFRDQTDERVAANALRRERALLSRITEAGPIGITVVDRHGQITFANAQAEKILGVSRAEITRRVYNAPAWRITGWAGDPFPDESLPFRRVLATRESVRDIRHAIEWPDGRRVMLSINGAPLLDAAGEMEGAVISIEDLTDRQRTEERLREQSALLDVANDAIHVRLPDETVVYWNAASERLYGCLRQEALGRPFTDLAKPDLAAFEAAQAALLKQGSWTGELKHANKSGTETTVFCRWTLLRDEQDRPKEILAIHTDITEHKQLEVQFLRAQRMEGIGSLAGGIAHDLNNILAPILMVGPLLRETVTDPDSVQMLETIESSAQRGADIVKQLLAFARGKPDVRASLPVRHILNELAKFMRETFPRNIGMRVEAPDALWPILGDATQIHQALMNLCVNARDAMPDGGTLVLSAENWVVEETTGALPAEPGPGNFVRVEVADTGTGIAPEHLERIFDPFFTTKEIGKGTGLGLATVLGIVRGHGGLVRVNSRVGEGTRFELYLPATPEAAASVPAHPAAVPPPANGELVLVVDDEPTVCFVVRRTLEKHGYRVLTAANGDEALTIFNQQRGGIKVVVTDMMMPGMQGLALVAALRQQNPGLPILGMTGVVERAEMKGLKSLALEPVLAKPFAAAELLNALNRVLATAGQSRENA